MAISNISNGESGLSIRTKLNEVISRLNLESVYNLSNSELNPLNAVFQKKTLTSDVSFTESFSSGQLIILHLYNGELYNVIWPSGIIWIDNETPVLTTADVIMFWKIDSTLYGTYSGSIEI